MIACILAFQMESTLLSELMVVPFVLDALLGIALLPSHKTYSFDYSDLTASLLGRTTVNRVQTVKPFYSEQLE